MFSLKLWGFICLFSSSCYALRSSVSFSPDYDIATTENSTVTLTFALVVNSSASTNETGDDDSSSSSSSFSSLLKSITVSVRNPSSSSSSSFSSSSSSPTPSSLVPICHILFFDDDCAPTEGCTCHMATQTYSVTRRLAGERDNETWVLSAKLRGGREGVTSYPVEVSLLQGSGGATEESEEEETTVTQTLAPVTVAPHVDSGSGGATEEADTTVTQTLAPITVTLHVDSEEGDTEGDRGPPGQSSHSGSVAGSVGVAVVAVVVIIVVVGAVVTFRKRAKRTSARPSGDRTPRRGVVATSQATSHNSGYTLPGDRAACTATNSSCGYTLPVAMTTTSGATSHNKGCSLPGDLATSGATSHSSGYKPMAMRAVTNPCGDTYANTSGTRGKEAKGVKLPAVATAAGGGVTACSEQESVYEVNLDDVYTDVVKRQQRTPTSPPAEVEDEYYSNMTTVMAN